MSGHIFKLIQLQCRWSFGTLMSAVKAREGITVQLTHLSNDKIDLLCCCLCVFKNCKSVTYKPTALCI